MVRKYRSVIFVLGIIMLLASCAKEGPTGPTGPAGPSYTGTISGHLSVYDQYGSQVLTGLANGRVMLTPLAQVDIYLPDTAIHMDVNGYYTYASKVITGSYSLFVTDTPGYAATAINSFQYLSGVLNKDIAMSAIPSFPINSLTAIVDSFTGYDSLVMGVSADTRLRRCIVFISSANTVSNSSYLLAYEKAIPAKDTSINLMIPAQDLYNAGFTRGLTVYYAAYSYVVNDASVYDDFSTGKKVYNAVGTVVKTSVSVP
jgi:hypothetical protein